MRKLGIVLALTAANMAASQHGVSTTRPVVGLSLEQAVEKLFAPVEKERFRWLLKILLIPDSEVESQLVIKCLQDGTHFIEKVTVGTGVFQLIPQNGPSTLIDERELMTKKDVHRNSRSVDHPQAKKWIEKLFAAVERTPTTLLRQSAVARSTPSENYLLHATTYLVVFEDYELKFRMAVLGPRIDSASTSSVPIVSTIAQITRELEDLLARNTHQE